jgi:hypothetical protein
MNGKASKRDRRRLAVGQAREVWADEEFGLSLDQAPSGRVRLRWDVDDDPGISLLAIERLRGLLDVITEESVLTMRSEGGSWADIGWYLGITGEACRHRYAVKEAAYLASLEGVDFDAV